MRTRIAIGMTVLAFVAGATVAWTPQDGNKPKAPPTKDAPPKAPAPDDAAKQAEAEAMKVYGEFATPGPEHARLAKKVGTWDLTVTFWPMPGMDPSVSQNKATYAMELGGRYLMERVEGLQDDPFGGKFGGLGVTGYNNGLKRFEYSWMDTMGTGLLGGTGTANAKGDIAWTSESYDPMQKKIIKTRGVERFMPDGSMVYEMYNMGPDGKEFKNMELVYKRKK